MKKKSVLVLLLLSFVSVLFCFDSELIFIEYFQNEEIVEDNALIENLENSDTLNTNAKTVSNIWKDITDEFNIWSAINPKNRGSIDSLHIEDESVIKIQNEKGRDVTFIKSEESQKIGKFKFVAEIKSEDVRRKGFDDWCIGKFQAIKYDEQGEFDWPDDDFMGTFNWKKRKIIFENYDEDVTFFFRIGLQDASGIVYVKNIRIFWKP